MVEPLLFEVRVSFVIKAAVGSSLFLAWYTQAAVVYLAIGIALKNNVKGLKRR